MSRSTRLVFAVVVLFAPCALYAQQPKLPSMEVPRLSGPITLDGQPTEAAWRAIAPLPLTMYAPVFQGTPTQRTEMRIAHDDENFYAAGWFFDTEPSKIQINSLYRDRWAGDDAFALYIDTFNDNQNAKWFGLTAGGTRFDILLSDDGNITNNSWDTFWSAKTTVTDSGWFAEVRIPFSSLGFNVDADGTATMGITLTRLVARLEERVLFPAIDTKFEFRRSSLMQDVVLRDVRTHKPLYVTPYVLSGEGRNTVPVGTTSFVNIHDRSREAGLDVRYPVSGNLNLDLTVNTDFAQVEADDQQVNLDRFPLFFPDRRRFFQERSEVFDYGLGGDARLFHSRRIGLTPTFAPVPIVAGARLVGSAAGWDVGLLEMQTRELGTTPAENFGVLRLRHPVLNPYSTAGLMLTSYAGGGRQNVAAAADGILRLWGDDYLTARVASTMDDADPDDVSLISRSHAYATLQRRTQRGLAYTVNATRSGRDFRPELGFMPRRNYTSFNLLANRYHFTEKHPWLRRIWPGALAFSTWRNTDHALESGQYAFWIQWETKRQGGGWLEPKWFRESVIAPFTIGNRVSIPAGDYSFADFQVALSMAQSQNLRSSLDFRTGSYFDGRRTQLILSPGWNASKHLELGVDYQLTALRFPVRDQAVDLHVARLRVRTAFNPALSNNAFIQYNSALNRLDANVRLRYAFAEGTDLWIVYNEGLDTDRHDPTYTGGGQTPLSLARTLIVKYSHTFSF
jgi:hypothetical protein